MSILAGIISHPQTGVFPSSETFRRYRSSVTSITTVAGAPDVSMKSVLYEVGLRGQSVQKALVRKGVNDRVVSCGYNTSTVVSDLFHGLARKYSNFSGTFERGNLGGVVERIAAGLATDSAFAGGATARNLLAGHPLRIHALSAAISPVAASQQTVFLPRVTDTILAPDTFSIIVHAVCGEGGVVATDLVEIDPNSREPIIDDVAETRFAPGCVDALRLLGANMAAADQGELFSLCVIRGLNSVLSVVGHTDEGGVIRELLRQCSLGTPYGGIHPGINEYAGLPALTTCEESVVAGYCDGILLGAAALVAHCDPGISYRGDWFPTVLYGANEYDAEHHPGFQAPQNAPLYGPNNKAGLTRSMGAFADLYCPALAKMFMMQPGGYQARLLLSSCASSLPPSNRHLGYPSIAPFFWVEPTTLIPRNYLGTRVEQEGFASTCGPLEDQSWPAFEHIERYGPSSGMKGNYVVKMRSARTSGYLKHFWQHEQDGVSLLQLKQVDTALLIHPGPCKEDNLYRRLLNGLSLDSYLWNRGQSPYCAPGELINLGCYMGLSVLHQKFNDDGYPILKHAPLSHELPGCNITFHCTTPTGISCGKHVGVESMAGRARTRAARSLAHAGEEARAHGYVTVEDMPVQNSAPRPSASSFREPPERAPVPARPPPEAPQSIVTHGAQLAEQNSESRGTALNATMVHDVVKGPSAAVRNTGPRTVGVGAPMTLAAAGGDTAPTAEATGVGAPPAPEIASAAPLQRADAE